MFNQSNEAESDDYNEIDAQENSPTLTGEIGPECNSFPNFVCPRKRKNEFDNARHASASSNESDLSEEVEVEVVLEGEGQVEDQIEVEEQQAKSIEHDLIPLHSVVRADYGQLTPILFCNSINSGDFHRLQGYFNTYYSKRGQFMASHEVSPEFGLPKLELLVGPLMMVHFFLGWFLMYPDLTVVKYSSYVTPNFNKFGRDNGTVTVTVNMVVRGTKVLDIPVADWLPSSEKLLVLNARDMRETARHSSSNNNNNNSRGSSTSKAVVAAKPLPVAVYGGGESSLRDSNIPESYIDVLHSKAIMLPIPQKMHSRVMLRMQLDEKNFIKSVNSSMIQLQ
jgi:hypothetical protein